MAAQPLGGHPSLCLSWYLQLLSPATRPAWEVATESLGLSCPHQPGDLTVRPQQIPWSPLERPNLADALIPSRPSYLPLISCNYSGKRKNKLGDKRYGLYLNHPLNCCVTSERLLYLSGLSLPYLNMNKSKNPGTLFLLGLE